MVAHTLLCFLCTTHDGIPYISAKHPRLLIFISDLTTNTNSLCQKSLRMSARGHGDLGSQEERGVLDELKPERNIADSAVKVSLTRA